MNIRVRHTALINVSAQLRASSGFLYQNIVNESYRNKGNFHQWKIFTTSSSGEIKCSKIFLQWAISLHTYVYVHE